MSKRTGPSGMTLIEIMMSVMVISLGVLGILAVIPFGMDRMGRVVESDYVASVGKKAVNTIVAQGWENPANWLYASGTNASGETVWSNYYQSYNPLIDNDFYQIANAKADNRIRPLYSYFIYPRLLDPFRSSVADNFISFTSSALDLTNGPAHGIMRVQPRIKSAGLTGYNYVDYFFRGHDDIVYERAENEKGRPSLSVENTITADNAAHETAAYTGAYTWMAMMTPVSEETDSDFTNISLPSNFNDSSLNMRVDAVVFRGRIPTDAADTLVTPAVQSGNGYAGGKFILYADGVSMNDLEKSLSSSTHLLLVGPNVNPCAEEENIANFNNLILLGDENDLDVSRSQRFAEWYQIAGFKEHKLTAADILQKPGFEVTLVGKSTPDFWNPKRWQYAEGTMTPANYNAWATSLRYGLRAVLFRNVRGVFTRVVPVEAVENYNE